MGEDRPALDVHLSPDSPDLNSLLDALLDDFRPFAVEDRDDGVRRVHFFEAADRDAAGREIAGRLGARGVRTVAVDVPDENWAERSQASLSAIRVDRVVITPPWDCPAVSPDDTLVVIRPSMGFGTGHHASTRLCLRALQRLPIAGRMVLDVGTGSGVLGITAAKLGAASVVAVDHDGDAVATARENVLLNDVSDRVDVRHDDFRRAVGLPPAAVVLANLSAAVVQDHITSLTRLVDRGGAVVVGGVLDAEESGLRQRLETFGDVTAVYAEDEWIALVLET